MNIVIFDEDPNFSGAIEDILDDFFTECKPKLEYALYVANDPKELDTFIQENHFDIVFMDITIPGKDKFGIEMAGKMRKKDKNAYIIFVTSHDELRGDIFKGLINPSQFLVKPAIKEDVFEIMNEIIISETEDVGNICVKFARHLYCIDHNNIVFVQKVGRKTTIYLLDELFDKELEVSDPVQSIQERLPDHFIMVDKGVLVNAEMISKFDSAERRLLLQNEMEVFVSRNAVPRVREMIST